MRVPESKIEEIRSAASIVDVISGYVQLRKRGKNYLGLCPFHNEKTPSFTVSEEKQIFNCFGCHAGGNVFKFLMEYEKISFVEAVQELAKQLGIEIEYDSTLGYERQSEQEVLYDINTEAAKYFYNNLQNSEEGEVARKYLKERKIKPQTITSFGLGYALRGWEHFLNFARERKLNLDKIVELGLLGRNDDGRLYDKFVGRLIFPIFSPNGRVVAFAGRILEDRENTAKYLNSPESQVYYKGRILYGLSFAKDEIRKLDKAILVEGYMDLISLYQSGIKNVVAVSGTALTDEQVQLLSRYTKNFVLLFDADTAGINASMRGIDLLLKRDIEVKIAALPQGEDPDSFVNKYGKDDFEELIKKAENFVEYQSGYFEKQGMFDDPAKMSEAIRELVKSASHVNDELKRTLILKSIAHKFKIRTNLIEHEFDRLKKDSTKKIKKIERSIDRLTNELEEQRSYNKNIIYLTVEFKYGNVEIELLKLLFENDYKITSFIFDHISPDEFERPDLQIIAKLAYESFTNSGIVDAGFVETNLPDQKARQDFFEIIFDRNQISQKWGTLRSDNSREKVLERSTIDTVCNFMEHKITEETDRLFKEITKVQDEWYLHEDEPRLIELMHTKDKLNVSKLTLKEEIMNNYNNYHKQN